MQLFIAHEELLHAYFTESRERMNQSLKKIVFYVISNIKSFFFYDKEPIVERSMETWEMYEGWAMDLHRIF